MLNFLCHSVHPSTKITRMHTNTHTSYRAYTVHRFNNTVESEQPTILAAFYLPIKDSFSSSSLVMNYLN